MSNRPGMSEQEAAAAIKEQWRKHHPKLYHSLRLSGELEAEALATAQEVLALIALLERQGLNPLEAWSQAMREQVIGVDG